MVLQMFSILSALYKVGCKSKLFLANLAAMIVVAFFGGYIGIQYVDAKHLDVKNELDAHVIEIKALNIARQQVNTSLILINSNLTNLNDSLKSVKKSVDDYNKQTVEIYRDLLKIKSGS